MARRAFWVDGDDFRGTSGYAPGTVLRNSNLRCDLTPGLPLLSTVMGMSSVNERPTDLPVDRSHRFELLAQLPERAAHELADHALTIVSGHVDIIVPPTVGMLMARAIDGAKGDLFNLAEILVTEARVTVSGHDGWAMVMGRRPDHALAVALIDACAEASPAVRTIVDRTIRHAASDRSASDARSWQDLAPTRVDFEISN